MQLLVAEDFTYNSHALKDLSGELSILKKTSNLQIEGGGSTAKHSTFLRILHTSCERWRCL
jgi:hypothetical protein